MMSTVTSRQADKYRLNYVEVEIGPPKRRDGTDKVPVIKVSNGNSNRVNYSTIVFPNKNSSSTAKNANQEKADSNGTRSVPQIPPHHGPTSPTFMFASQTSKEGCHPTTRVSNSAPGGVASGGGRKRAGQGGHSKLERKGSQLTEAQMQQQQQQQQQQLEISKTPPNSPPRRRALSTPTRSRKFPSDPDVTETIEVQQEKEPIPPKTRTLPPREKPWKPDPVDLDCKEDGAGVESLSSRRADLQKAQAASLDSGMLSNSAPSSQLTHAMQAMRMKARRKSSSGDAYEVVSDPTAMAQMAALCSQEAPTVSPAATEPPPLSPEAVNILHSSPVMKRHRTELEKAFARRKLTGRISGEPDGYASHSGSHSSSGESSPQEGMPSQFSEVSSMGARFIPVLPIIKSSKDRGTPDGQKASCGEYRNATKCKPIPAPRFGQQSRESSSESINDPLYLNQRPMPSPPSHQQASPARPDVTASSQQVGDDTYMNIAFGKTKQDNAHRYENVFLDDRTVSLDRCSNASDSPRDSLEIHSNRPIPAPRMHGSNSIHAASPAASGDHSNQHHQSNQHRHQDTQHHQGKQRNHQGNQHHHQGNQAKPTSSQYQQGKQHGHTRQGSYGSTAVILSHINAVIAPLSPSSSVSPGNKSKQGTSAAAAAHQVLNDSLEALYATPCKHGQSQSSVSNHHGQKPMKATHGIAPEVPPSPKPEIPSHSSSHRRGSHDSTGSIGSKVTEAEKSSSIGKALGHLIRDGEKRERKHRDRPHGEKKSREDRKAHAEKKGHHGDREKRGHGKRHRGDSHSSSSSSKSKLERPSYGNQPWYYGRMLRQECEYLMLSQGQSCQYLVRDSSHRTGDLMLSVLYGSKVHHYVIQTTPNHKFHIAHHDFNMVEDILEFYHHHVIMYSPEKEPVYLTEPFILKHK
ncbi:uncharacterized protein LOC119742453 isoform X2 [Patiria miniata]|uniref:SH2 domain-containing protein n=1 Tax=Patiria miniata TaxID=46514 RepID=A0A914BEM1_PATMI|nr:uncharacterized protein LOC119742453 isoform X2 [Patiria miniata]